MNLSKKQRKIVIEVVNYMLDRLFSGVKNDRQAKLGLMFELGLQDSQVAGWRMGRNLPNAATLYRLADASGVLGEIAEAISYHVDLEDFPELLTKKMKSKSGV